MGPRDIENGTVEVARRDTKEKNVYSIENIDQVIQDLLETIQENIYNKAKDYQQDHITEVDSYDEFKKVLDEKGGFVSAHWDGTAESEEKIKDQTKATIRCIPLDQKEEIGKCILTGNESKGRVLFAKAY